MAIFGFGHVCFIMPNYNGLKLPKINSKENFDMPNRAFQSAVFNSGQKMALRAFYFIRALTKALTYYYINQSQRHLLAAIENN